MEEGTEAGWSRAEHKLAGDRKKKKKKKKINKEKKWEAVITQRERSRRLGGFL